MRSVTVLGSTGSVGKNALDIVRRHKEKYRVTALAANNNVDLLIEQAKEFSPLFIAIGNEAHYQKLKAAGLPAEIAAGEKAVLQASAMEADLTVAAIVGFAGLGAVMEAVSRKGIVALANKEALVCAGGIITAKARETGASIIPVDSEHNAIFQVFDRDRAAQVEKITLTASGGPFLRFTAEEMRRVTPEQAVKHPNWNMGAKISVDSATMMNKGLEMIEAFHLFPVQPGQIDVVVHPESVVHSTVSYVDGSVLAQLASPDMRVPLAYAMAWPERVESGASRLDLTRIGKLTFEEPDLKRFPALRLAREALEAGGAAPIALNAANEAAVAKFLKGEIEFTEIAASVERALSRLSFPAPVNLEEVGEVDRWGRGLVLSN